MCINDDMPYYSIESFIFFITTTPFDCFFEYFSGIRYETERIPEISNILDNDEQQCQWPFFDNDS